jgi:hypothetical protein
MKPAHAHTAPMTWTVVRALANALLVVAATNGCTKKNPSYCDTQMDCPNGQHCDLATHGCVADENDGGDSMSCTGNAQCTGSTPICENGACRACSLDDECDSGVCRADGACESSDNVLYVDPNGPSAGACTSESPCDLMYARSLVTASRYSLRLANGMYSLPGAFIVSSPIAHVAIIGGRSAVFARAATGPSFDVRSGSSLTLRGITLNRGLVCDTGTIDIENAGFNTPGSEMRPWLSLSNCVATVVGSELDGSLSFGVDSNFGGSLTLAAVTITRSADSGVRFGSGQLSISGSTIAQNMGLGVLSTAQQTAISRSTFYSNRMGGVSAIGGVFDVTNNFIYRNGNAASSLFGGLRLDTNLPGNRVEHNTITRNDAQYGATPLLAGGLYCRGGGTSANNLVTNNFYGNEFDPNAQIAGTCNFTGSLVVASDTAVHFKSSVQEPFDYHLADAQSSAVNAGVVSTPVITEDFDGEARDATPDVGADELRP